jgi:CRP/FNR family transcriptional regulator, cyclic AMP receptor protein
MWGGMIGSLGRARKIELLGQMPLFAACTKRQLEQVAALAVPIERKKGTVMTRQGAAGGLAFIIVTGTAEVVRNGKRVALLGPGGVVGELSLIDGKPRSATVTATSDLEALALDRADLFKLVTKAPSVMRKLLESMAQRLRDTDLLSTAH